MFCLNLSDGPGASLIGKRCGGIREGAREGEQLVGDDHSALDADEVVLRGGVGERGVNIDDFIGLNWDECAVDGERGGAASRGDVDFVDAGENACWHLNDVGDNARWGDCQGEVWRVIGVESADLDIETHRFVLPGEDIVVDTGVDAVAVDVEGCESLLAREHFGLCVLDDVCASAFGDDDEVDGASAVEEVATVVARGVVLMETLRRDDNQLAAVEGRDLEGNLMVEFCIDVKTTLDFWGFLQAVVVVGGAEHDLVLGRDFVVGEPLEAFDQIGEGLGGVETSAAASAEVDVVPVAVAFDVGREFGEAIRVDVWDHDVALDVDERSREDLASGLLIVHFLNRPDASAVLGNLLGFPFRGLGCERIAERADASGAFAFDHDVVAGIVSQASVGLVENLDHTGVVHAELDVALLRVEQRGHGLFLIDLVEPFGVETGDKGNVVSDNGGWHFLISFYMSMRRNAIHAERLSSMC